MMKRLFLSVVIVGILFTCVKSPVTGTGEEVNTGTIFGMLLTENKPVTDTVTVKLYRNSSTGGASKVRSGSTAPLQTFIANDGSYTFDSLPAGTYRIEVAKDEIVIGETQTIALSRDEHRMVNITIVVIINQTFNVWTEQNQIVRNITVENGKIVKTDSGYVLIFAETDTLLFEIELKEGADTSIVQVRTIRHADGTVAFEIVGNGSDVVVTPGIAVPDTCIPSIVIDTAVSNVANGDTILGDTVRIVIVNEDDSLRTRFRWKADTASWSAWDGSGDSSYTMTLVNVIDGRHTVSIEAGCGAGISIADAAVSFFVAKKPVVVEQCGPLIQMAANEACTLWVAAEGTGVKTCAWYKDGALVDSSGNDTLICAPLSRQDAGKYVCQVKSAWGETFGDTITVTVAAGYAVTYIGNGNTVGAVPVDGKSYRSGDTIKVTGNTGNLAKTGFTFIGWNRVADGSGVTHAAGSVFTIDTNDVVLYAQWVINPTFTVVYNGNGHSAGDVPVDNNRYETGNQATVLGNNGNLVKQGYTFNGWNGVSDGSGADHTPGSVFPIKSSSVVLYAKWVAIPHTVTFDARGGSQVTSQVVPFNGKAATPATPVRAGYTFMGWFRDSVGTQVWVFARDTITVDCTLYAKWSNGSTFAVAYDGNGSTSGIVPSGPVNYETGATVAVLGNAGSLVKTGHTFAGWNTAANGNGSSYAAGNTFVIGTSSVILYAVWTSVAYTITFDSRGGSAVAGQTVAYGGKVPAPAVPVKSGETFTGWFLDLNGTEPWIFSRDTVTSALTLFAKWTSGQTFVVTYNANGGTGPVPIDPYNYETGAMVTVIENAGTMTRPGYIFAGWNTAINGSGTAYMAGDTFTLGTAAVTLYASWTIASYGVTFDSRGGSSVAGQTVAFGGKAVSPATPVRSAYTFIGWFRDAACTQVWDFTQDTVIAALTLFAGWAANPIYTVTYNANGGTGPVPTDAKGYAAGATVPVLGNSGPLVLQGYYFTGWNTAADGSGASRAAGSDFSMGSANVTLYAQWASVGSQLTVTYVGNGNTGGAPPSPTTHEAGHTVSVLTPGTSFVRAGHTFTGWSTEAGGGGVTYTPGSTFTIGSTSVVLYARWQINSFLVTYNGNGSLAGTAPSTQTADYGTTVIIAGPGDLSRTGYIFTAWNTAADGSGTTYAAGATFIVPAANVMLYAIWQLNQFTVSFNAQGGTVVASQTVIRNGTVTTPQPPPTRTGATFGGWFAETACINAWNFITQITRDTTLYARWILNSYLVTFDAQGGSAVPAATVTYNSTVPVPQPPQRSGNDFAGWYTGMDYVMPWDFVNNRITGPVTIYARWNPGVACNPFTVPVLAQLDSNPRLPDPFRFLDGTRVMTKDQWACRRREIRALAEDFLYGHMPPRPASVTGTVSVGKITVNCTQGSNTVSFFVNPTGSGSILFIDFMGGAPAPSGVRKCSLNPETMLTHMRTLYGTIDAGLCMAAAWGVDRIIDVLELNPGGGIDATKVVVTGCSNSGKYAAIAGAFCDRVALTVPVEAGICGTSSWRVATEFGGDNASTACIDIEHLTSEWLGTVAEPFRSGQVSVNKLPIDQHEVIALCAPRPVIFFNNYPGWVQLCAKANVATAVGAHAVYAALGVPDNLGFAESASDHSHCLFPTEHLSEVQAFYNKFLFGQNVGTRVMRWSAGSDLDTARWIDWNMTPTLP